MSLPELFDTHAHLHFPEFGDDLDAVLARARAAGVRRMLTIGTDLASSHAAVALAGREPDVWAAVGIHPHDAAGADEDALAELERLASESRVVAIGETGLDFFRNLSPAETQREVLNKFFELHRKTKKPLVLHVRDAYRQMREQIQSELGSSVEGVLHCFSSDKETMKEFLDLGFHISFAGPLTYKKNDALREAFEVCPLDKILLETDAPFLPPQTKRGSRNESGFLLETARLGAALKKISLEELGRLTSENAKRFFRL